MSSFVKCTKDKVLYVLGVVILLVLCSCADTSEMMILENESFQFEKIETERVTAQNVDVSAITEDPNNEVLMITGDSIVYFHYEGTQGNACQGDFFQYMIEEEEHIKLGTIYNASYCMASCFINNKLYIPQVCQLRRGEEPSGYILELDLNTNSMSVVSKGKGHESIYGKIQGVGKHLLLMQTKDEFQRLVAYDTETKELYALVEYHHDPQQKTGEWILSYDAGSDMISVEIKVVDASGENQYRIDVYDYEMNLINQLENNTIE